MGQVFYTDGSPSREVEDDEPLCDPRDARIAELEAFVREVENIETAWVTGTTSAQESMIAVSEAWRVIRAKMQQV